VRIPFFFLGDDPGNLANNISSSVIIVYFEKYMLSNPPNFGVNEI